MDAKASAALQKNLRILKSLKGVAQQLKLLPSDIANYYANGGPGVGQAVVGDRFSGEGNARFAPLSKDYEDWKTGKSKSLNKQQKVNYGKGSRLLPSGSSKGGKILPILVLTGALRASILSRQNTITQQGDTAYITFKGLPGYAVYLHEGTSRMPERSPVKPNEADMDRVKEYVARRLKLITGNFSSGSVAFGGAAPRIIK